jgi:hypothetical protein
VASFTCALALQRLALQTSEWFSVVTAGLAGNGVSGILPGRAAVSRSPPSRYHLMAGKFIQASG